MSSRVTITRPEAPIRATIELPRSKSIANRALILASLAGDLSCVKDAGDAEDTRILHDLLTARSRVMHCGLGGTTLRFLLAWASVQEGEEHAITGEPRLLERPHDELVNALRALGADVERKSDGYLVRGRRLTGGTITLHSPISSQYISALMLIAPMMRTGLRIEWRGRQLSRPYVQMTARTLRHFGAYADLGTDVIEVRPGRLSASPLMVPRDWSAAGFWYQIVALASNACVRLPDLQFDLDAWQGDQWAIQLWGFAVETVPKPDAIELLPAQVRRGVETRLDLTPDLFQPLALTFAGLGRGNWFNGLWNLPVKEADRLSSMRDVLATLGLTATYEQDRFALSGAITDLAPPPFDPRGDHRMAMALAPLALVCDRITILDPDVVKKSYPGYWDDLRNVGFTVRMEA